MENNIQPNPTPIQQQPQVPIFPPIDWTKISLFSLLGLIVIAGSVFAGVQIGKGQVKDNQLITEQPTVPTQTIVNPTTVPTQNPTSVPTSLPTAPNPTTNPLANWKTYTETREVKFSIQYPVTWKVDTKDGMYGEKGARFDSDKEAIGSVGIGWNSQPVEPNCNTGTERKESVQIKGRTIEMCHSLGSTQEPEGYFYNGSQNGVNFSIVTSNYPGEDKRKMILKVLSTLSI